MRLLIVTATLLATSSNVSAADPLSPARIVVEGHGVIETPPQIANIEYELRGEGKSSDEAAASLVDKAKRVELALRSIDPGAEPRAESVTFTEVRGPGCRSERYDNAPRLSVGPCAIIGYFAVQKVAVKTSRVQESGTMVGLAARSGATDPEIQGFGLSDRGVPKQQAIAAAIADAREKAQAIASGSGVALGPIISVSLDRAQGEETIVVTGSRIQGENLMQATPVRIAMVPKTIETNAQVTITFAINR